VGERQCALRRRLSIYVAVQFANRIAFLNAASVKDRYWRIPSVPDSNLEG
jgi:hypothetical protein